VDQQRNKKMNALVHAAEFCSGRKASRSCAIQSLDLPWRPTKRRKWLA
jgi:hypothetical protein